MVDHVRLGHLGRGDVVKAIGRAPGAELTVLEAGQTQLVVTYPDETLHDAISKLLRHDIGRLPVVSREEPKRVVGYLGRAGILAARRRSHQEETVRERGLKRRGRALTAAQ